MKKPQFYVSPAAIQHVGRLPEQTTWDLDALRAPLDTPPVPLPEDVRVTEDTAPGPDGTSVPVRVCTPEAAPRRVVVSIHGGGYVTGSPEQDDPKNTQLAHDLGAVVVSPDYRLAPEHPLPAGWNDVDAAVEWAASNHPDLPLFIHGDSAGGGLAYAAACTRAQAGKKTAGLILFEPCLDPSMSTESFTTHADGPLWTRRAAIHAWAATVGDGVADKPFPEPRDLQDTDFPPTLTVVNPVDPLRDEGIELALGIVDAGFESELHMFPGTVHASLAAPQSTTWLEIMQLISRFVER